MSGLLRRIRGARAAAPDPAPDADAVQSPEGQTAYAQTPAPHPGGPAPLPAGSDLDQLVGAPPATRRRSRLRKRLRHLRQVREVLLRDLGGLVYELHRSAVTGDTGHSHVVRVKLQRLDAVTTELHALEDALGDRRGMVLREPGIGGTCPTCGELFGSDARFCWACGTPVAPGARRLLAAAPPDSIPALAAAAAAPEPAPPAAPVPPPPEPAPHVQPDPTPVEPIPGPGEPVPGLKDLQHPPPPDDAPTAPQPPAPHIEGSGEELGPEAPPPAPGDEPPPASREDASPDAPTTVQPGDPLMERPRPR
jgi:hypothetical protein